MHTDRARSCFFFASGAPITTTAAVSTSATTPMILSLHSGLSALQCSLRCPSSSNSRRASLIRSQPSAAHTTAARMYRPLLPSTCIDSSTQECRA
jgi:hypothetical protein